MVSKLVAGLVEEIFVRSGGERERKVVQEDPEACLVSLLMVVRRRADDISAALDNTIEQAMFPGSMAKAKEMIEQSS